MAITQPAAVMRSAIGIALNEVDSLDDAHECDGCGCSVHTERCRKCGAFMSVGHHAACMWPEAFHEHYDPLQRLEAIHEVRGLFLTLPCEDGRLDKDGAAIVYQTDGPAGGPFDVLLTFSRTSEMTSFDHCLLFECRRPWDPEGFVLPLPLWRLPEDELIIGLKPGIYGLDLWLMND